MALYQHPSLLVALAIFLTACTVADVRARRIPNVLTGVGALCGTTLSGVAYGMDGVLAALGGLALGLMILTPAFALDGIGGGDVKMMGAAGTFVGPKTLLLAIAAGLLLGGIVAIAAAARRGELVATLRRVYAMVVGAMVTRSAAPLRQPATRPGRILLPYSVPLALGTIGAVGWTWVVRS